MSRDGSSKLFRWLGSVLTLLMLVTMLFCYLWFQVAIEIMRTKEDSFVMTEVTIKAIGAPLVAFMVSLPLLFLWHLGEMLESSQPRNFYTGSLLKHRFLLLSLVVLISTMGYFEARSMENLACHYCGEAATMLEKSIGLVTLFLCPILCLGKIVLSAHSRMRLRAST